MCLLFVSFLFIAPDVSFDIIDHNAYVHDEGRGELNQYLFYNYDERGREVLQGWMLVREKHVLLPKMIITPSLIIWAKSERQTISNFDAAHFALMPSIFHKR